MAGLITTKTRGFDSREQAVAFAKWLENAVNAHDVEALVARYADNAVMISPVFHDIRGRDAIAASWREVFQRFPDWQVSTKEILVDGDRLAFVGTCTATDRNGWFGLPPTGEPFTYQALILLTMCEEKIVRDQRLYDQSGVLEHIEKIRMDQELQTAAEVQNALLSRTVRRAANYEASGDSLACRTIGGDFFDFFELPGGSFAMLLGDVAGKGASAALLASMLQGMFTAEARIESSPAQALANINLALAERRLSARFATLVYATLSPDGRLAYSNAGHNAPIVLANGSVRRLATGGPILGAFANARFEQESLHLNDGDLVVMFSDGVTEAVNEAGDEFGEERLIALIRNGQHNSAAELTKHVLDAVTDFSRGAAPSDDITVSVLRMLS